MEELVWNADSTAIVGTQFTALTFELVDGRRRPVDEFRAVVAGTRIRVEKHLESVIVFKGTLEEVNAEVESTPAKSAVNRGANLAMLTRSIVLVFYWFQRFAVRSRHLSFQRQSKVSDIFSNNRT